ncbi:MULTISPECIES: magnesium transporter [unclassified Marinobacterium]|jgi:magnesium transporter|uniref:magnesium transporter n=1 Tax=unclassified Marinobacterium TaxID=2644139 RepID=UPI001568F798|nr:MULTISPECIES: magnesium transporter [unclassified Marinobacterium]NRP09465.1 Magnesium transporter MgtE [Marinobacterium sp. xm-g-48]NRP35450.1 Magnesium transporter MgtE [Marinobacterium sp. xm-d-579]NRP37812.1 Magnesium transporter MgtE [Marinobacterium sp. xm-a-121]NRP46253.1 Magnesium transporter MgtE [Marinobacterium sp. xm-d-543]NRP52769.1 Magnesium transporter MgtE [Marinobacterium sp. xm-v-242]
MSTDEAPIALDTLSEALQSDNLKQIRYMLNKGMRPVEVAHLLEKTPPRERRIVWNLLNPEIEGEVLQHLGEDIQAEIVSDLDAAEILAMTESLDVDDLADILQQLPDTVMQEMLQNMDLQNRQRVEAVLSYPDDTAGGLMNTDTVTIRPDITVETALRYLRRHSEIPDSTDSIFVVSRKRNALIGVLPITRLLISDPQMLVREIMKTENDHAIPADLPEREVARIFEQRDLISAPVINEDRQLLGRITIDDVVDVIREDADHSLMSMAGLDEDEDTFAPVLKTSRRRAVWLGINLITAFLASAVIGLFEATIDQVVALAVLMPIVASMGGIAGSQTLTLVIRGQALGHIERHNIGWLFNRELIVSIINGSLWAVVVAAIAVLWFQDMTIGIVIAMAIVINLVAGAMAGSLLPLTLKQAGIDPALAGGVLLTTITDVVGFFAFLGLATFFYG